VGTNTTQLATTAYVLANAASATPLIASGAGAVGTATQHAREDHVHPIDNTAWTAWTPTVTAGGGTITTVGAVTARYKQVGKTVFFYISITITTNGTGVSYVQATLPFTAANTAFQIAVGRENSLTGKTLGARIVANTANLQLTNYDGTYPGANGALLCGAGQYETT
jgi:hypothetical protein